jgi:hypothetical protein
LGQSISSLHPDFPLIFDSIQGTFFAPDTSLNKCSDSYPGKPTIFIPTISTDHILFNTSGSSPFSAPEVASLRNLLLKPSVLGFLDLHSFGQLLAIPYSNSCDKRPVDEENLLEAAIGAAIAGERVHGKTWEVGMRCKIGYLNPGNSLDWSYESGIKHSFELELRDKGTYGYLLPPGKI